MRRGVAVLVGLLAGLLAAGASASASVVLNEVNCEGTDWVELVNTSPDAVDLSGWLLTDDPLDSTRADHRLVLASGAAIPGHGALVIEKSAAGFPFGVKCGEDTIRLADAAGNLVDAIVVPALTDPADTWGRYPSGTGEWRQTAATRDAPNTPSESGGTPPADAAAWLFEPGKVVEIDLGLSEEARAALAAEPDQYVDGTFSLRTTGGTYGPYDIGVRLKGSASFRPLTGKSAFKISFNHVVPSQRFLGLRRLTLNNMVQDHSMLHELLTHELFRAVDVPAPRTGHAFVRVNGEAYGVYLDIETLDRVSLPRWFTTTQHLYEGPVFVDAVRDQVGDFEVDEGDEDERSDLEALADAAAAPAFSDAMGGVADLDELTRMWAVEHYVGHWDGYSVVRPNNYYLHSDAAGRFSMLPWGADQTWVDHVPFAEDRGGVLFRVCVREPACRARYRAALELVGARVAQLDLGERVTAVADALAPWQQLDPRREYSLEQIAAGVAGVRNFLATRPAELAAWLAPQPPTDPPPSDPPPIPAAPAAPASPPALPTVTVSGAIAAGGLSARPPLWRVGTTRARRTSITTTGRTHLAGVVEQRANIRIGGRVVPICGVRASIARAGAFSLRCELSPAARRRRAAGTLRVTVHTRFAPAAGPARTIARPLLLERTPGGR